MKLCFNFISNFTVQVILVLNFYYSSMIISIIYYAQIKRCHSFLHTNFYKCACIVMIFGMQLSKWTQNILVNLLCYVSCTCLRWSPNVDINEITSCTWHCQIATERNTTVHPCRDVVTQFIGCESGGLQCLEYPSGEGIPFADSRCERAERTSAKGVEAAGPLHHHHSSNCTVAYSFERMCLCEWWTFCTYDFLVCFVRSIDIGVHKFDRCKHMQSANIAKNVLLLCLKYLHGTVATKWVRGRKFFGILLQTCAQKTWKISLYLQKLQWKISDTFYIWTQSTFNCQNFSFNFTYEWWLNDSDVRDAANKSRIVLWSVCSVGMAQVLELILEYLILIRYSFEYSSSCFQQNCVTNKIVYSFFITLVVKIIPNLITNWTVNVHFNYNCISFVCKKY